MRRTFLLMLTAAMLTLALTGCGGDDDDSAEPTAPSGTEQPGGMAQPTATEEGTPEPTATPDPVPPGVRSIIQAARTGNTAALERAIKYEPVPCTTNVEGIGGPPECAPGEADGTPVEVVFATTCEGFYARRSGLALDQISFGVFGNGDALYGVYEIPDASQLARVEAWAGATVAVVMNTIAPTDATLPYVFVTDGASILGTATGCGESPEQWVANEGLGEPLLTP
jgi:hypothetical protein